jgi:catechol 2,3-dioxygenase-like lactoylglutathione lyase family enzyme
VQIKGIVLAGTSTDARPRMRSFLRAVMGMRPAYVDGMEADIFDLPDGTSFAVADAEGMGAERTVGFLVDDLDAAAEELRAAGIETDDAPTANARWRYLHFRAPDGQLYELVEPVTGDPGADR